MMECYNACCIIIWQCIPCPLVHCHEDDPFLYANKIICSGINQGWTYMARLLSTMGRGDLTNKLIKMKSSFLLTMEPQA